MERKESLEQKQCDNTSHCDALVMAELFTSPVSITDSNGERHFFRTFLWMGRWGICSGDKKKLFVRAKANYLYAKSLDKAKVLIAGSADYGWDVYSLEGELLETLDSMPLNAAIKFLNAKKRNSQ